MLKIVYGQFHYKFIELSKDLTTNIIQLNKQNKSFHCCIHQLSGQLYFLQLCSVKQNPSRCTFYTMKNASLSGWKYYGKGLYVWVCTWQIASQDFLLEYKQVLIRGRQAATFPRKGNNGISQLYSIGENKFLTNIQTNHGFQMIMFCQAPAGLNQRCSWMTLKRASQA